MSLSSFHAEREAFKRISQEKMDCSSLGIKGFVPIPCIFTLSLCCQSFKFYERDNPVDVLCPSSTVKHFIFVKLGKC